MQRGDVDVQRKTVALIIDVMDKLMRGGDYETAMREVLKALSIALHGDRIYILEMRRRLGGRYVEWCADGVRPRIAELFQISDTALKRFFSRFVGTGVLFAASLEELGVTDGQELDYFQSYGVNSVFSLPLYDNGRFVGCLCSDNYAIDDGIDIFRLIETIGPCMATAISNHQLFEELEWSGTHDSLTGLLNRPGIDTAAEEAIKNSPDTPYAVALVDIDDFKAVNDLYGHEAGDEALVNLSNLLAASLPEGSIIGRNGGDELLVMLIGDNVEKAQELFDGFARTPIEFQAGEKRASVTSSIGFATYPDQAEALSDVCRLADAALYSAKLSGKARAAKYSAEFDFSNRSQLGYTPRDIAENIPGAVAVFKAESDGDVLYCNKPMAELFECESINDFLDYCGDSYRNIVHADDADRVWREAAEQASRAGAGGKFSCDFRIVTKSGAIKNVAQNGHLVEIDGVGLVVYSLLIDCAGHAGLSGN